MRETEILTNEICSLLERRLDIHIPKDFWLELYDMITGLIIDRDDRLTYEEEST